MMPAIDWTTIWSSVTSRFKRGKGVYFITGFYLKQHKRTKQIRLVQWLKDYITQEAFYANISIWPLAVDLRKFVKKIGKRIKKPYRKCP